MGLFQGFCIYFQGFCIKIVEFLIRLPWLLKSPIDRLGIILTIRYLFGGYSNDLLDPNVDNHYEPERIRIYKIVANVEDEIHGDGLSYVPDGACFVPILGPQSICSPGVRLVK